MEESNKYEYVVYDGLARDDVEKASIISITESLKEAMQDGKDFGDYVIFKYEINNDELINGVRVK